MPYITKDLIRKRAEHNEGIISTLEEISLHQEELESINETLGSACRKLKILYLQNNIISKMENLHHMKELEYLNMALNNIHKIEGLQNCEFLSKLDLTANFIDFDTLEESIQHLVPLVHLKILYMMGNPCQVNWIDKNDTATTTTTTSTISTNNIKTDNTYIGNNFESYIITKLPQLRSLDGIEITKSMQIIANQKITILEKELKQLAESKRQEKAAAAAMVSQTLLSSDVSNTVSKHKNNGTEVVEEEELTENTPEARVKIYKELAEQKKEKDDRNRINEPRERHYDQEQHDVVKELRHIEEMTDENEIKQKNEGGWTFLWDEESQVGIVTLEVKISSFLDSSLIDVDIHPTYISIIIKTKLLRLRLPAEVKVSESRCQRSKATGSLLIIMPKVNPKENAITIRADIKAKQQRQQLNNNSSSSFNNNNNNQQLLPMKSTTTTTATSTTSSSSSSSSMAVKTKFLTKKLSLQEELQQEYMKSSQSFVNSDKNNNNNSIEDFSSNNNDNIMTVGDDKGKRVLITEIMAGNSSSSISDSSSSNNNNTSNSNDSSSDGNYSSSSNNNTTTI